MIMQRYIRSVDAYFADFDEMNSIITAQTGKAADLVRFKVVLVTQ